MSFRSIERQRVVDQLKVMRLTGEPVWITLEGRRLLIHPVAPEEVWRCNSQVLLFTYRSRFYARLCGRRKGDGPLRSQYSPFIYVRDRDVRGVVVEDHPRPPAAAQP